MIRAIAYDHITQALLANATNRQADVLDHLLAARAALDPLKGYCEIRGGCSPRKARRET